MEHAYATQHSWKSVLTKLVNGKHLDYSESQWSIDELMDGNADPAAVSAMLAMQKQLGLTAPEVAGAAASMVAHALPLEVDAETTDIVGTGGDGASTVNLSTMAAIVAASCGITIVKHGNRAASSRCGAADCLEALGLPLDLPADKAAAVAHEVGITFAFAKTFHPAMRHVAPVRGALGIPTIFNVLGPLTNPAKPAHMAIGAADRAVAPIMAQVYADNGQSGLVFTSSEGLDEMAPTGPMSIWQFADGSVRELTFDPVEDLGLTLVTVDDLRGGEPHENAQLVRDFLDNKDVPFRQTAILNAAAAIVADGYLVNDTDEFIDQFKQAYDIAEQAVESGKAKALLERWIHVASELKLQEAA